MKNRDSTLLAWLAVKLLRTIIKTAKWLYVVSLKAIGRWS